MIFKMFDVTLAKLISIPFALVVRKDDFGRRVVFLIVFAVFFSSYVPLSAQEKIEGDQQEACELLLSKDVEEALVCSEEGIRTFADSIDFSIVKGQALRRLGRVWDAKAYFQSLLSLPLSQRQQAEISNNLGKVNANLSLYDEAAASFLDALSIMEALDDRQGQAFYLNNVGIVYDLQADYENALSYYQQSLALKRQLGMNASLPASYTNIGVTLYNLGQLDSSLYYHRQALSGFQALKKDNSIARSMNNVGFALIDLGRYEEAEGYLVSALQLREQIGDQRGVAQTRSNLAKLNFLLGRKGQAWILSQTSVSDARALGLPEILRQAWTIQQDLYASDFQYAKAFSKAQQLDSLKDEIALTERSKKVAELEAKYQSVKKEKELQASRLELAAKAAELESEVVKRNSLLLLSLALLITTLTIAYGYRQKNRASMLFAAQNVMLKKEKQREELLRAQLGKELDQTRLHLEDKNKILNQVYAAPDMELPPQFKELSAREKEVLSYLALGWSDKEIAEGLYVSVTTVKTHLRRVYSKLLVKGRAEAVSLAHTYGIIGEVAS